MEREFFEEDEIKPGMRFEQDGNIFEIIKNGEIRTKIEDPSKRFLKIRVKDFHIFIDCYTTDEPKLVIKSDTEMVNRLSTLVKTFQSTRVESFSYSSY